MAAQNNRQLAAPEAELTEDESLALVAHLPSGRHAILTGMIGSRIFGGDSRPTTYASMGVMLEESRAVIKGDLTTLKATLVAQAATLDATFTELVRRSCLNMGEHLDASERYMRLALKAQANCRATIEAIDKLQRPHEQVVKHVHVNEGAQAIVADQFHHHAQGAPQIGKADNQPQALTGSTDACGTALRGEGQNKRRRAMSGSSRPR